MSRAPPAAGFHDGRQPSAARAIFTWRRRGWRKKELLAEVAPDGWQQSPLLECLHPSVERVFEEQFQVHRNIDALGRARIHRDDAAKTSRTPLPEPTLEEVRREYQPKPVRPDEELTELVGQCLWDVFSDNHEVIAADARVADIGSFRGASAFLDEYMSGGSRDTWRGGDYLRFYTGTIWVAARADLTPVYAMIFRRLQSAGADWVYHVPELGLVDLGPLAPDPEPPARYSVSEGAVAELHAQQDRAELERTRAEFAAMNARAREDALDGPPPATVCAYRNVYARDPRGWPPA